MALTRKEIDARHREKCKKEGKCPACGKKKDRAGYYCNACKEKNNKRKREDKEFCRKNGICTTCQKERVYGNEKMCFNCKEKAYEKRASYTDEQKERYKRISMESARRTKERFLRDGICPICRERKLEDGRKKCRLCLNKDAERQRMRRINNEQIRRRRKEEHLCYFCGGEIDVATKNVCSACSEKMAEYSARANKNKYWKGQNNLIFKNN